MQIIKYGVTLESIKASELELIRNWRNSEYVRPFMNYREYITPEMQQRWFNNLDHTANLYFMIIKEEKKIGVINLKDIHTDLRTAEAGIFIGDPDYMDSMVPFLATVSLMEFAFDSLHLTMLKAKINKQNSKVILFNKSIGYRKAEEQEDDIFQYYTVTSERFYNATEKIRGTLDKMK